MCSILPSQYLTAELPVTKQKLSHIKLYTIVIISKWLNISSDVGIRLQQTEKRAMVAIDAAIIERLHLTVLVS